LAEIGIGVTGVDLVPALTYITAATTAASGISYLCHWVLGIRLSPQWQPRVCKIKKLKTATPHHPAITVKGER
jgi:hypothetical protein